MKLLGVFLVLFSVSLRAQDAGTIFGTVNDASGAIVAGAKVTLLNVDTNSSQETRTDSSGDYIFTPVRIGNYTVKVDMAGFSSATRPGLVLNVQQRMRVDFNLALGSVDQSIEIRAESPLLLATLLAAEHAVLMVASILPEGERRRQELAARAAVAARERVGIVEADAQ